MISFDGDRSKRRRWFVNKQIGILRILGLSSKNIKWDGFSFKAWVQGILQGGRVEAPAGLMVLCSTTAGVQIAMSDYWGGATTALTDLHVIGFDAGSERPALRYFEFPEEGTFGGLPDSDPTVNYTYDIVKFEPDTRETEFGREDGAGKGDSVTRGRTTVVSNPAPDLYEDYPSIPGLHPFRSSEGLWISITDRIEYPDPAPVTNYTYVKSMLEHSLLYYMSDNSGNGRVSFLAHEDWHWYTYQGYYWNILRSTYIPHRLTSTRISLIPNSTYYFPSGAGNVPLVYNVYNPEDTIAPMTLTLTTLKNVMSDNAAMGGDIPTTLQNFYGQTTGSTYDCGPAGFMCFELDGVDYIFHACCSESTHSQADPETLGLYFENNHSSSKWNVFYSLSIDGVNYIFDSSSFMSILEGISTYDLSGDVVQDAPDYEYDPEPWRNVAECLRFITMVPPTNYNSIFPHDSYMFFSHLGEVVCWNRRFGAFKFTKTGMENENTFEFTVPSEVTDEDGVQPRISYSGTYDDEPMYLCICDKVAEEIKAIYYGSPFDALYVGWTKLPDLETGTLLEVRPVLVSPTRTQLIGVAKTLNANGEDQYQTVYLDYVDSESVWKYLGAVPVEVVADGEAIAFAISLFGNAKAVNDMASYPTPVSGRPQIPIAPYNLYNSDL